MTKKIPDSEQCAQVAGLLKTLAHPQRLMILSQLTQGPKSVSELEELSGASQSAVSQFLGRMRSEDLVEFQREEGFAVYRIKDPKVLKLVQAMYRIFCE